MQHHRHGQGSGHDRPQHGHHAGVVVTDAALEPAAAQQTLSGVVDETFNCISVDGHMSTNDTVLLLANGAAGGAPLVGRGARQVSAAR